MGNPQPIEPVRLLASGRDASLTCEVLARVEIACEVTRTVEDLCRGLEDVQVLILAEECLTQPRVAAIAECIKAQPAWSDLPVIVVAKPGGRGGRVMGAMGVLGNVTVLGRPLSVDELITAVRAGMRARRRQFEVRDLLLDREDADRRKDEFLAMLAHELRNPLAPIRNAVGIMHMLDVNNPDFDDVRDVLERQVRHMSRLTDDLLDVARITRGKIGLRTRVVDIVEIAKDAARIAAPTMKARGHRFDREWPEAPIRIEADPTRIEQVISNLLSNAAKYTKPGGLVRLVVETQPPHVVIRVEDDGVGIDSRTLPHVFDLFAQSDRPLDRTQGGLGIGLTMVKKLVDLHGGLVEIQSEGEGLGTEVVVRLPLSRKAASDRRDAEPREASTRQAPRVLVVEDNRDAADMLACLLRCRGYEVRVAYDGPEGVATARGFHPQVVISDIGLPGMDGYEMARRLREDPALGHTLLVAVSGYGADDDVSRALSAGFDHHFVKPVDPDSLTTLIGRAGGGDPHAIEVRNAS